MRISVRRSGNAISETARDLQAAAVTIPTQGSAIVHSNGERLNRVTRAISRSKAGPHGTNFANRDRKSTRQNSSHQEASRMPSSA